MQRRKAFTLIELLVVMAIIALLVSILAPSLTKILGLAKDTQCSTNIDAIKKSMMIFAASKNDYYPNPNNTLPIAAGGAAATTQTGVLSRFAYKMGVKGEMFICPSTQDVAIEVSDVFNGGTGEDGSYSYQICDLATKQVTNATENDVVFIADKAPTQAEKTAQGNNMSPNHNDGEFILAASKGATVKSEVAPDGDGELIGRLQNDIYAPDDGDVDPQGTGFTLRDDSYLLEVTMNANDT